MRNRILDENDDYTFGKGLANFYTDVPEAPAQAVSTRLSLRLTEWYLDLTDGTPWATKVLGKYTGSTRDVILQARTLGTPEVNGLLSYASQVDVNTRAYSVQMLIDTTYGTKQITELL